MDNIYENNRNPEIEKRFAECDGIYCDFGYAYMNEDDGNWIYQKKQDDNMWIGHSLNYIVFRVGQDLATLGYEDYGELWSFDKPDWWDGAKQDGAFFRNKPGG